MSQGLYTNEMGINLCYVLKTHKFIPAKSLALYLLMNLRAT